MGISRLHISIKMQLFQYGATLFTVISFSLRLETDGDPIKIKTSFLLWVFMQFSYGWNIRAFQLYVSIKMQWFDYRDITTTILYSQKQYRIYSDLFRYVTQFLINKFYNINFFSTTSTTTFLDSTICHSNKLWRIPLYFIVAQERKAYWMYIHWPLVHEIEPKSRQSMWTLNSDVYNKTSEGIWGDDRLTQNLSESHHTLYLT